MHHQQQTAFENIVGKEEIACNKQFLLSPQWFLLNQKFVSPFINIYDTISLFAAELKEVRANCKNESWQPLGYVFKPFVRLADHL